MIPSVRSTHPPKAGDIYMRHGEAPMKLIRLWKIEDDETGEEWVVEMEGKRTLRFLELGWPERCPVTGRKYWGHVTHPERGSVPTYGGPFDTYMIPERVHAIGDDDEWSVERYDQDAAQWITEGFL